MDDFSNNPANTGKHVSVNIAGQKDVSVQSKLYNNEVIPIDNEVLNRLLGFGTVTTAADNISVNAPPSNPKAYDPAGEVDYGVFLATVPESGSLLDDSLALTGTISDLGVPFVGTVVNLTQNAIEGFKSDALGILVTNGGRPVYIQTYNSWTARGGTPFNVILYCINAYGLELRSAKNPVSAAKNILFPSQMHRGYPDFYMGVPSKSKNAYLDFLEFFVEQQLPFQDLAKNSISEAAYSILKEMDASVGGLLDPSGKPTELGQKVLEYIEKMKGQSLSTTAEEYDISKTIVHGQETVRGTGEETSYQTSIQRTTWEEHSETTIHLFTTGEEWSTATTIHPEHAANFDFTIPNWFYHRL